MASAITIRIWELLLSSSCKAASQPGARGSTSYTESYLDLPQSEQYQKQNEKPDNSCIESNESLTNADTVSGLIQHDSPYSPMKLLFKHEPLDHDQPAIRLVTVSRRLSTEGYIQCFMRRTTIHANYACLSYAWGKPKWKRVIQINGRKFHVQQNLFDFLDTIRHNSRSRHEDYWIDALCIDQSNAVERNHQVAQMGMIYSGARRVIAWLGPLGPTLGKVLLHVHVPNLTGTR